MAIDKSVATINLVQDFFSMIEDIVIVGFEPSSEWNVQDTHQTIYYSITQSNSAYLHVRVKIKEGMEAPPQIKLYANSYLYNDSISFFNMDMQPLSADNFIPFMDEFIINFSPYASSKGIEVYFKDGEDNTSKAYQLNWEAKNSAGNQPIIEVVVDATPSKISCKDSVNSTVIKWKSDTPFDAIYVGLAPSKEKDPSLVYCFGSAKEILATHSLSSGDFHFPIEQETEVSTTISAENLYAVAEKEGVLYVRIFVRGAETAEASKRGVWS